MGTGPPWDLNVSEEAGDTIGEIFYILQSDNLCDANNLALSWNLSKCRHCVRESVVVINVCGSYFLLARNVGNVFVYYVAIMLCVTYLDVHIWLKLPYIYLQFHIVPLHSVDLPHPLLC